MLENDFIAAVNIIMNEDRLNNRHALLSLSTKDANALPLCGNIETTRVVQIGLYWEDTTKP